MAYPKTKQNITIALNHGDFKEKSCEIRGMTTRIL